MKKLGFEVDLPVETNMVWANSTKLGITFEEIVKRMQEMEGPVIKIHPSGFKCRLVTHLDLSAQDIDVFVERLARALQQ